MLRCALSSEWLRAKLAPVAFLTAAILTTPAAAQTVPLPRLTSLDDTRITVSGLSSGGFFAHQFHVAYSSVVGGAGIIAGGPYACAEQIPLLLAMHPNASTIVAVGMCTRFNPWSFGLPSTPDPELSIADAHSDHRVGRIDDPANLADDRVWLFWGTEDTLVPRGTMLALERFYREFGVTGAALSFNQTTKAAHGLPVDEFRGTSAFPKLGCLDADEPPYILDCDLDAAGKLLEHLHPGLVWQEAKEFHLESLLSFDQSEFFDRNDRKVSLADRGFVYVPQACQAGAPPASCRLHIAFHGCNQNFAVVGDDFVADANYNRWAEANGIVVLYPQTKKLPLTVGPLGTEGNPRACWDWWGYSGSNYLFRDGKQMRAVRAMVERLIGK